ncbi:MAG: DUF799 family lipoprotein [Candidatus Omnitrophota bacterium]|nr:DUF799 family lipoprotein [Candidatus Omnitrophota bacterium]
MRSWRMVMIGGACLVLAGCGGSKPSIREGFLDHPPRRVAILPFAITFDYDLNEGQTIPKSHTLGRDLFRKTFYHAFATFGYEDRKLADVDAQLTTAFGPIDSGAWRTATPQAIGVALGVDALIYCEIDRIRHMASPLYTDTTLAATLRMVDARTGEELWRQQVKAADRGGALIQKGQVIDFLQDQARSYNPGIKFLRVADVAVRHAIKGLPNPPWTGTTREAARTQTGRSVRLAVLPFAVKKPAWQKAAASMRSYLAADLQESPFEILELQQVDAVLTELGWKEGEPLSDDLPLQTLAQRLGADSLLRGTVTNFGRTYAVVESWVKAELQVDLVDAHSGTVIWSEKQKDSRTAGILKGPTGYKSIATAPLTAMKTSNLERVSNNLTHKVAQALTESPAVMTYVGEKGQ